MRRPRLRQTAALQIAVAAAAAGIFGCKPDRIEPQVASPFQRHTTIAVAPLLNFSGEFTLDPVKASDLLASELSDVDGIYVLPVNRVVAVLAMQGKQQIESPAHALSVAETVGADAILVAGVTEYDPYTPVVGVAIQMYVLPAHSVVPLNPVALSRQPQPAALGEVTDVLSPTAQVQVVYNAKHKQVVDAVRHYARSRSEESNPFGWEQYLKVQSLYLRFCWHDAVERLMEQERSRQALAAEDLDAEVSL